MTARRARLWRWALAGWALTVAAAAGLTLWLRDTAEPQQPYGWYRTTETPAPSPRWGDGGNPCPDGETDRVICVFTAGG